MEKFDAYSFEDFLEDPSFIRFVKKGEASSVDLAVWQDWLNTQPNNIEVYLDARAALIALSSVEVLKDTAEGKAEVWSAIEHRITQHEQKSRLILRWQLWSSAAAAIMLVFCGLIWYYQSKVSITTAYGEHRAVVLPDGTRIMLNAHTTLSYWRAWRWHRSREAWLEGEALFDVVHLHKYKTPVTSYDRFAVHVGPLDVNVLGTLFNVKSRRGRMLVSLIKGRVQIFDRLKPNFKVILSKGEAITYHQGLMSRQAVQQLVNKPLAWVGRSIETKGMSVAGIIENYEDTYGGKITVDRPELLSKKIDGHISLETRESALYMLANLLNANVERRDSVYYLKSK